MSQSHLEVSAWGHDSIDLVPGQLSRDGALGVGVLTNILSGRNKKSRAKCAIRQLLTRFGQVHHAEVETPAEVRTALREFAHQRIGLIVINGGDGTVQAVLTALLGEPIYPFMPLLAVLPAGTTSMIAGDIGLTKPHLNNLETLLARTERPPSLEHAIQRRHVLAVQPKPEQAPIYGMFFGAACIWQGIEYCRSRIHTRGVRGELGPGLALARFIWSMMRGRQDYFAPTPFTLRVNDQAPEQHNLLILLVSTLERLLMGVRPYAPSGQAPLYYTGINAVHRHTLRVLPALLRARPHPLAVPMNGYWRDKIQALEITMEGGFTLDGELFETAGSAGPVRITDGGTVSFVRL